MGYQGVWALRILLNIDVKLKLNQYPIVGIFDVFLRQY